MPVPTPAQLEEATCSIIDKVYESEERIQSMQIQWELKEINGETVLAPTVTVQYYE